jgi:hypothetical protein
MTFLGTAIGLAVGSAVKLFRYRSVDTYYTLGDTVFEDRNYWRLSNTIPQYYFLAMGSLATFTQLLDLAGMEGSLNLIVWAIGLAAIGGIIGGISQAMSAYAYETAYLASIDDSNAAKQTAALAVMNELRYEMLEGTVEAIGLQLELEDYTDAWWQAQMDLTEDSDKDDGDWSDEEWEEGDEFASRLASKFSKTFAKTFAL